MSKVSNRLMLISIALLFFAPLMLAVLMRSDWWSWKPEHMVNHGILVIPPVPVDFKDLIVRTGNGAGTASIQGRWTVLYVPDASCDDSCLHDLAALRQIRKASGRHREQVVLALLDTSGTSSELMRKSRNIYAQWLWIGDPQDMLGSELEAAARQDQGPAAELAGHGFLLDPAGNIILHYPRGYDPNDINQDLQRLLKWSPQEKSSS